MPARSYFDSSRAWAVVIVMALIAIAVTGWAVTKTLWVAVAGIVLTLALVGVTLSFVGLINDDYDDRGIGFYLVMVGSAIVMISLLTGFVAGLRKRKSLRTASTL